MYVESTDRLWVSPHSSSQLQQTTTSSLITCGVDNPVHVDDIISHEQSEALGKYFVPGLVIS